MTDKKDSPEILFIDYLLDTPHVRKWFPFEAKKYIFLRALKDYFEEKTDIFTLSMVAEWVYTQLSEHSDYDGNYIADALGNALFTACEIEYYYSVDKEKNEEVYLRMRKVLELYYEENKTFLESK